MSNSTTTTANQKASIDAIQFFCPGLPIAQGSKRHVGKGILVESSKALAPWRQAVAAEALKAAGELRFHEACHLQACFWFPHPSDHYRTGKYAGALKKTAPLFREKQPDLDKLLRALGDALVQSGVLRSDALIVKLFAEKRYGDPGVLVRLQSV